MTSLMFESFQVQGLYVANQAMLSLFSNGRTTGLFVDSGDGVTQAVPFFEGFSIPHAVKKNYIAGRAITYHMVDLLTADGIQETGNASQQIVINLKEDLCFVSLDPAADKSKAAESSEIQKAYELPDGQTVNVNAPRFMAPEALFNPGLIKEGDETPGMHTMAFGTCQECDLDIRKDLYSNVILS